MNMRVSVIAILASVAGVVSVACGQFAVTVQSSARYQGSPLQAATQTVTMPPPGLGDVASVNSLSDPTHDGFSFARGEARFGFDAIGGYSKNYAWAAGFNSRFSPPNEVVAESRTTAALSYRVSSPSTPVGTPIRIRTVLGYDGQLGVANYFGLTGPGELVATFGSSFTIGGVSYFDATASLEQRQSNNTSAPIFSTTGPWGAAWTASVQQNPSLGDFNAFALSYSAVVAFDTVMAADFDVVFTQFATARVPRPIEALASADFSHTGRFTFEAYDAATGNVISDARFTVAPAPGATLLLAGFVLRRRRRRG
ncbi:MAG: hypothetical protein JSR77_12840 [Planctomycetes bacterium]|nr:hypothetical protein [Planctomycetota bacterium]